MRSFLVATTLNLTGFCHPPGLLLLAIPTTIFLILRFHSSSSHPV
ncbi:MAG: hypothetical protein ACYS22_21430 [Planctomycetota bacterium]|jgi:hypothetical protein